MEIRRNPLTIVEYMGVCVCDTYHVFVRIARFRALPTIRPHRHDASNEFEYFITH